MDHPDWAPNPGTVSPQDTHTHTEEHKQRDRRRRDGGATSTSQDTLEGTRNRNVPPPGPLRSVALLDVGLTVPRTRGKKFLLF